MMTFEERPDKGENWIKTQKKREQLLDRDLEKANKPRSVFDKDNDEETKPDINTQQKDI